MEMPINYDIQDQQFQCTSSLLGLARLFRYFWSGPVKKKHICVLAIFFGAKFEKERKNELHGVIINFYEFLK
jgi:hypothetical protein